ncbi:MAG: archaellin/type IV pilin N-terminal domain-containing protein, partial [Halobacteriales archaeon]
MSGRSPRGGTRGRPVGTAGGRGACGRRGQSEVVGVALMLGVTLVALGTLTASIGAVVDQQAGSADAARVGADLETALRPVTATGTDRGSVSFAGGELAVVDRQVRILDGGRVVRTVDAGGLVYRNDRHRVAFLAGAVVRGEGDRARFRRAPPVTVGERVVVVGAPALNASPGTVAAGGPTTLPVRTNVSHRRHSLGNGTWAVAVETAVPGPWRSYFSARGATVSIRDLDGDGVDSVVARFAGRRTAYLVVHAMHLEVAPD